MTNNLELKSDRLVLKPVRTEDAKGIFAYRSDAITNKYQGWIPKTIQDVDDFLNKVSTEINTPDTWFQFSIRSNENPEIIGDLGIHFIGTEQAEIGCTLARKEHGKGYATEALRLAIGYLFNDLDKHRIIGSIDPENTGSIRLLERLGFRKEAHFKESLLINGEWVDDIVYGLLKREWQ